MAQNVLLVSCPDQTGLIHRITGHLHRRELNIVENAEFVDRGSGTFFMRTEFTGRVNGGGSVGTELLADLRSDLPAGSKVELQAERKHKLVILATKEPHCLGDLLLRHSYGELPADVLAVVSQYDSLSELTARFGIPFHHVPVDGADRAKHEQKLLEMIQRYSPDYLVLAKYMRILTNDFVSRFPNRVVNIHHSFLPAFIGASPYQQAFERGVKIIGATSHFVNEQLDEGPIITQSVTPVDHTHSGADMARAGRDIERVVLARALGLVLEHRVIVQGRRTIVFE